MNIIKLDLETPQVVLLKEFGYLLYKAGEGDWLTRIRLDIKYTSQQFTLDIEIGNAVRVLVALGRFMALVDERKPPLDKTTAADRLNTKQVGYTLMDGLLGGLTASGFTIDQLTPMLNPDYRKKMFL